MNVEINKMQVDIDNLKKQNVNDFSSIKELYNKFKEIEDKITQIKYIDTTLSKKLQKDYEKLKKIIMDENVQAKLYNDIESTNTKLDNIDEKLTNDIATINSQMDTKANKNEIANGLTAKGNIPYNNLPTTGNSIGDYYYCNDGDSENGSGNYVWNGTSWYFGGTGDYGYSRLRNEAFDAIYGTNLWNPSNVIENAWLLDDGTIQSPSPYGDDTYVYNGTISGEKTLYITYENGETRSIYEISRYVMQDIDGNVLASGKSTLVNGLAIPKGATTIKILGNITSLSNLLQMEYDKISPYEEYTQPYYKIKTDTETVKNIVKEEIDTNENLNSQFSRLRNDALDVIYGTNLWNPSNVILKSWLTLDGNISTPSPYGDNTFVYSGEIEGGNSLFITYQNGDTRDVFEISRFVIQDDEGNVLSSGSSTLVNGLTIPTNAKTIKILSNTPALNNKLQMEYNEITSYSEYVKPYYQVKTNVGKVKEIVIEEIKNHNIYKDNSFFFSPSKIYMYSGIIRYIDKMNIVSSKNESSYYLESPQNDPSQGYSDKIGMIYGVNNIKVRSKNDGEVVFEKSLELNKIDPTTMKNPSTVKNIMMIGDSYTANNILPCDIKNQLVNTHGKTNYNFIGMKVGNIDGVTCNHEGRAGYSVADYIKTDNTQGRGTTFSNPYLKNGEVSIKTYCDDNTLPYPDVFIVELGINDIENDLQSSLNKNIKKLLDLIHNEFANAKILLVGVVYSSKINEQGSYVEKNKNRMLSNKYYEDLSLDNNYKSFVKYVDVGALFNTEYGYDFQQVQPYRGSTITVPKINDWLHPCKSGYYMESDCIVPALLSWNIS